MTKDHVFFLGLGYKFVFEFDGPSHYTSTKTQIRDILFADYCRTNNLKLIRIPYFMQLDSWSLPYFFYENDIQKYDLYITSGNIDCKYTSGFHDKKIVYPGDYNSYGFKLFWKQYCQLINVDRMSIMREIYESLDEYDTEYVLGICWELDDDKVAFIENYPT